MAFFKSNTKGVGFSIEALRGGRKHAAMAGWDAGQQPDSSKSLLRLLSPEKSAWKYRGQAAPECVCMRALGGPARGLNPQISRQRRIPQQRRTRALHHHLAFLQHQGLVGAL